MNPLSLSSHKAEDSWDSSILSNRGCILVSNYHNKVLSVCPMCILYFLSSLCTVSMSKTNGQVQSKVSCKFCYLKSNFKGILIQNSVVSTTTQRPLCSLEDKVDSKVHLFFKYNQCLLGKLKQAHQYHRHKLISSSFYQIFDPSLVVPQSIKWCCCA